MSRLTDAQRKLVADNLGLVGTILKQYRYCLRDNPHISIDDLYQEGVYGLMRAARKWRPARGKLGTYAGPWIHKYIKEHIACRTTTIALPSGATDMTRMTDKTRDAISIARNVRSIDAKHIESLALDSQYAEPDGLAMIYRAEVRTRDERLGRMIALKLFGLDGWEGTTAVRGRAMDAVARSVGVDSKKARKALKAFLVIMRDGPVS